MIKSLYQFKKEIQNFDERQYNDMDYSDYLSGISDLKYIEELQQLLQLDDSFQLDLDKMKSRQLLWNKNGKRIFMWEYEHRGLCYTDDENLKCYWNDDYNYKNFREPKNSIFLWDCNNCDYCFGCTKCDNCEQCFECLDCDGLINKLFYYNNKPYRPQIEQLFDLCFVLDYPFGGNTDFLYNLYDQYKQEYMPKFLKHLQEQKTQKEE